MIESIRSWLTAAALGLVEAVGAPSVAAVATPVPNGKGAIVLVREGYRIEPLAGIDVHQRVHRFDDLVGFSAWLKKHAKPEPTEVLFETTGKVSAALDPANRYGDIVTATLKQHPRLARWLALRGKKLDQRTLHRHIVSSLEDFPPAQSQSGAPLGSSGEALAAALTKLAVKRDGSLTVTLDELGYTRFAAGDKSTDLTAKIPPKFLIRVPWFLGASPTAIYDIEVHLAVNPGENAITFELEFPAIAVVEHQALLDAVTFLTDELGEEWLVGLGTLAVTAVPQVVTP